MRGKHVVRDNSDAKCIHCHGVNVDWSQQENGKPKEIVAFHSVAFEKKKGLASVLLIFFFVRRQTKTVASYKTKSTQKFCTSRLRYLNVLAKSKRNFFGLLRCGSLSVISEFFQYGVQHLLSWHIWYIIFKLYYYTRIWVTNLKRRRILRQSQSFAKWHVDFS